jgi:hypothetical protein
LLFDVILSFMGKGGGKSFVYGGDVIVSACEIPREKRRASERGYLNNNYDR